MSDKREHAAASGGSGLCFCACSWAKIGVFFLCGIIHPNQRPSCSPADLSPLRGATKTIILSSTSPDFLTQPRFSFARITASVVYYICVVTCYYNINSEFAPGKITGMNNMLQKEGFMIVWCVNRKEKAVEGVEFITVYCLPEIFKGIWLRLKVSTGTGMQQKKSHEWEVFTFIRAWVYGQMHILWDKEHFNINVW